jgi:hypothetical protein
MNQVVQRVSELIRMRAALSGVDISPSAKLDKWTTCVRPLSAGKVASLGSRDVLPNGSRIYELGLDYEAELTEDADISPRWPGLQGVLYESDFYAQLYTIFDTKKRQVGVGDAFTSPIKVKKGKVSIRLQVRHTSVVTLEALSDMCMMLERPLSKPVPLTFFKMKSDCLAGINKQGTRAITAGGFVSMYIKEPAATLLPKQVSPGDVLTGSFTCLKSSTNMLGSGTKPGGFPLRYVVADNKASPPKEKQQDTSNCENADKADSLLMVESAIKEVKLKHLRGFSAKTTNFQEMYERFAAEYPNDLQFLQARFDHLCKLRENRKYTDDGADETVIQSKFDELNDIKEAGRQILAVIDETLVAATFGVNLNKDDAKEVAARKVMDSHKAAIVAVHAGTAKAIIDMLKMVPAAVQRPDQEGEIWDTVNNQLEKEYEKCYAELSKWDDINASKYWQMNLSRLQMKNRWGAALKLVNDLVTEDKVRDNSFKEALLEVRVSR